MPCNYLEYPPKWKSEIRPRILKRAGNKCEFCGAENYKPHPVTTSKVILTVMHLDHDPGNWDINDSRLRAACQKCHLNFDRVERYENKREAIDESKKAD